MSFLTGLITGFLNEDVRLRENQREYEAKLAEKKELARQEIAKENRAWKQEQTKIDINQNYDSYKAYLDNFTQGKVKKIPNATSMFQVNQQLIRAGKPPIFDFNKAMQVITKPEDANTVFGSGANKISYGLKLKEKLDYDNSSAFINLLATQGSSKEFIKKINGMSATEKEDMLSYVNGAETIYRNEFMGNITKGGYNPETTPRLYPTKYKTTGFTNIKSALGVAMTGSREINMKVNSHEEVLLNDGRPKQDTYFFLTSGNTEMPNGITFPANLRKGFQKVSNKISPDKNPKTAGYHYANIAPIRDVTGTLLKGDDISQLFNRAVVIANEDSNNAVDPDRRLYRLTDQEVLKFHKLVYDGKVVKAGELDKAAMVLMPSMLYPNEGIDQEYESQTTSLTFQNYVVNFMKGKQKPTDLDKISKLYSEMKIQRNETKSAIDDVVAIIKLTNEKNETDAFSRLRNFALGTFSIEEGFLGDVLNATFGKEEDRLLKTDGSLYDNGKQAITAEFLKDLEDGVLKAKGKDQKQGELEALRISVAFKMARAADPSGRLSNQDIELQLTKLGGAGMFTPKVALTKLGTVLRDLKRGFKTLDVIVNYGASGDFMTRNDQRYLDAVISANELQNRMDRITYNVGKLKKGTTSVFSTNPTDYKPTTSGRYMDGVVLGIKDKQYYYVPNNDYSKIIQIPSGQMSKYLKKDT